MPATLLLSILPVSWRTSDGVALGGKRRCHGAEHERASRRRADRLPQSRSWLHEERTMMLVYDLPATDAIYQRFVGIDGSAYFVGGFC